MAAFTFAPFDDTLESFQAYVKRLEQHFLLHDIAEKKRLPALLSLMGAKTYSLLTNLVVPEEPETKSYEDAVQILVNHLSPPPNKITERIKFRRRMQGENETIQEFCAELKKLTTYCAFSGDSLTENLLEQFLRGLRSEHIQQRLLMQVVGLTFDTAVQHAITMQAASADLQEWKHKKVMLNKMSAVSKKVPHRTPLQKSAFTTENNKKCFSPKVTKCYRCGDTSHLANKCKFINAKCQACGRIGHLKIVCRSSQLKTKMAHSVDVVDIMTLRKDNTSDPIKIRVKIENTAYADMELDTGSAVSTIPRNRFTRFFPQKPIFPPDVLLRTATGEVFEPAGMVNVSVHYGNQTKTLKWYLVKDDAFPLLLGRDWLKAFSLSPDYSHILPVNTTETVPHSAKLNTLLHEFSDLFEETIGEVKGIKAKLHVPKDAKPVFCKARTVTYALRKPVEQELQKLENEGIIKPVTHSKWATPIVPVVKPNGKIRICGDFKVTVNKYLDVDKYPLPKIDDILASLSTGKHFSKLDLTQAYLHLAVEEDCQELLTITTHKGLYKFTRLPYGISSAPAIWQRTIEQILSGIEGVNVFIDDICVTGPTTQIHLQRLEQVFKRLQDFNLKLNKAKSSFFANSINYCGYKIDSEGIHKTKEKIEAILNAPRPTNVTQVKAFLGLVSYYGRFIPDLSTMVHPLNQLLHKTAVFQWTGKCETAFRTVKQEITSDKVLTHFNPELPLILSTDASSYGISAVLSHQMPDGCERPISFASRTLTAPEKRYSQIDKEALAIVFGVKKFFQYLYGRKFTLFTDHKPLVSIFSPHKSIPVLSAARMQRYALYLQSFKYDIRYKKTTENGNADALSRLPLRSEDLHSTDEAEIFQIHQLQILPVTAKSLAASTKTDPLLKILFLHLNSGTTIPKELLGGGKSEEFTLEHGCILKGCRVVIPEIHRQQILHELHDGHFGIAKMKALARSVVWWPGIDKDIENLAKNCTSCVELKHNPPKVQIHPWEWPSTPWQRIHVDFAGPIMGKMLLLVIDSHSKWPEVFVLNKTSSEQTIHCLRALFSRYGLPISLVSDNGPQFTSQEFKNFLNSNGIKHHLSAPYHPATNGQVERFVQTIKKGLKAVERTSGSLQDKINTILMQYRKMQNATTGESPASLFLKRNIRTRLDLVLPNIAQHVHEKQISHSSTSRTKQFSIGDKVAARNYTSEGKWKIGYIVATDGTLHYRIKIGDTIWRRHVDQLILVGQDIPPTTENFTEFPDLPLQSSVPSLQFPVHPSGPPDVSPQFPVLHTNEPPTGVPVPIESDCSFAAPSEAVPAPSSVPLRRSSRKKRKPCRLTYG